VRIIFELKEAKIEKEKDNEHIIRKSAGKGS
jgi:hypothetical protein